MHTTHNDSPHSPFQLAIELTPDRPISAIHELARTAESVGIDAVFVSNHFLNRDPFLALAGIAEATDQLMLGPGVINPYESHPGRLATQMASLDEVSDGRAVCGLGAGDGSTLGALGLDRSNPATTVHETIDAMRELWAGDRVDHHGTFTLETARLNYPTRRIPIYVGAQGPVMLRMSAAHADGVLVNAAHPADYVWAIEHLDRGRAQRDPDLDALHIVAFASVSVAREADRALAAARPPVAYITAGAPEAVLTRHELDTGRVEAIREALANDRHREAYDLVTPAMIRAFSVAGTTETVLERLSTLFEHVDAVVAAAPLGADRETAIELIADVGRGLRREV